MNLNQHSICKSMRLFCTVLLLIIFQISAGFSLTFDRIELTNAPNTAVSIDASASHETLKSPSNSLAFFKDLMDEEVAVDEEDSKEKGHTLALDNFHHSINGVSQNGLNGAFDASYGPFQSIAHVPAYIRYCSLKIPSQA